MKRKKTDRATLRWVYQSLKKFTPAVLLMSAVNVVTAICYVRLALVSKRVIDIATGKQEGSLRTSGAALLMIIFVQVVLFALNAFLKTKTTGGMTMALRGRLFSAVVGTGFRKISSYHSGDILNRFTSDTDVVVTACAELIPNTVSFAARIVAGVGALFVLNPAFAAVVLIAGITVPLVGRLISARYKKLHKEVQRTEGETRSFLQECFENLVVLKSFSSEGAFSRRLNKLMRRNYRARIKRSVVSVSTNHTLYLFYQGAYYVVLVWGAGLIAVGAITYGTLMAFLQLISTLTAPLLNISGLLPQYYSAIASAERLIEMESGEKEPHPDSREALDSVANRFREIRAEHVSFSYTDEETLKDCTFSVPRDCITALTGPSGCGKSTFFKLLLGLYEPTSGSITFSDGTPVSCKTRPLFAYVPQGNLILSGSIRDNITLCDPTACEEEMIEAARAAEILDVIRDLPDGFDTVISERGAGLSEGQLQRISIARALLTHAPVLLLDESTSALDEATESRLLSNIKALPDKTVLFITHRGSSKEVCDHIIRAADDGFHVEK